MLSQRFQIYRKFQIFMCDAGLSVENDENELKTA